MACGSRAVTKAASPTTTSPAAPDSTVDISTTSIQLPEDTDDGADVGFGFDGDGDRLGLIDSQARIVWGDQILLFLARDILKRHPGATIIGDVKDRVCVIIDDICDTAGTLVKAAELLSSQGAREVHAYITHGVLSGPAIERVTNSVMKSLVITDSIEPTEATKAAKNIRIVPTAPIFAQAILNIWHGTSVSSLFDPESLEPIYDGMYT